MPPRRLDCSFLMLIAGTAGGADLLGVADKTGTLEAGKFADIAAVPGNPLNDMEVTQHPVFVTKEGAAYRNDHGAAVH
jgi:imidazolonepropionase-like amidohydrolase